MLNRSPLFAAASLLPFLAFPALAEEAGENVSFAETIIVTGARTGEFGVKSGIPLERMPQSVQILDEDFLIERGFRSIGDVLRAVPSANVGGSRVSRYQSTNLKIRGFSADQMRNGMRQKFYEDVDASALSNIERIEVLKGPSAVLFGQSAVGGIISIVTKQPTDEPLASIALTGGMYNQKMLTLDVGGPLSETLGVRLTGEIERSGTFVDHQDIDRENVGLALAWTPGESVSAHLAVEYQRRVSANNPGLPVLGTILDNGIGPVSRRTFLGEPEFTRLVAEAPLIQAWVDFRIDDNWTLTPRAQYSRFDSEFDQLRILAPVAGSTTRIQRNGRRGTTSHSYWLSQIDLSGRFSTGGIGHQLLMGVEYSHEITPFYEEVIPAGGIPPIDALKPVYAFASATDVPLVFAYSQRGKVDGFAFYAQDQIALLPAWDVVAGIRYSLFDYQNVRNGVLTANASVSNLSWQLGTTYQLGGGFSLFGGYNTGFNLDPVIGARTRSGEPFEPETSDQIEAGLRFASASFRGSLSAFRIRRNNVATTDPLDVNFQVQQGQMRVQGIEAEAEWRPLPGWWLQGGYAWMDGELTRTNPRTAADPLPGARLGDTPKSTASLSTRVALGTTGIELRGGGYYVGSRAIVTGSPVYLDDYLLLDAGIGAMLGGFRVDATLSNLTDKRYFTANGGAQFVYPGDPRTLSVRVGYSF